MISKISRSILVRLFPIWLQFSCLVVCVLQGAYFKVEGFPMLRLKTMDFRLRARNACSLLQLLWSSMTVLLMPNASKYFLLLLEYKKNTSVISPLLEFPWNSVTVLFMTNISRYFMLPLKYKKNKCVISPLL